MVIMKATLEAKVNSSTFKAMANSLTFEAVANIFRSLSLTSAALSTATDLDYDILEPDLKTGDWSPTDPLIGLKSSYRVKLVKFCIFAFSSNIT